MQSSAFSLAGIKKMAAQIEFVSFDMIQILDKEMKSHWFKSENIDLYYYQTHTAKLVKFHMSLFGQVLEWTPRTGLRTGLLVEVEIQDSVTESIQYDLTPNPATLAQTLLVLRNALSVDERVRRELISKVEALPEEKFYGRKKITLSGFRGIAYKGVANFFRSIFDSVFP